MTNSTIRNLLGLSLITYLNVPVMNGMNAKHTHFLSLAYTFLDPPLFSDS